MKLFFVRHGDTLRGPNGVYGYEAPLTDLGFAQAEQTGRFMAGLGVTKIVSSDAVRALQTAEPLVNSLNLELNIVPELTEIDIGIPSDGVTPITENRTTDGRFVMDCTHLEGESWEVFRNRVLLGLSTLANSFASDDVLAVFTHGGVKSVAVDHYHGREISMTMHTLFNNGSISTVESTGIEHVVHGVNDISHLV